VADAEPKVAQVSRRLFVVLSLLAAVTAPVAAQPGLPDAGLAAEAAGRWTEALDIYQELLRLDEGRSDLWTRVSDIEAHLGNPEASVAALLQATLAASEDATLHHRLSQAYAASGEADAALQAIEVAHDLDPGNLDYLRARAVLATWAGDYRVAADSYRRLNAAQPDDQTTLGLARVSAWSGDTDEAVEYYRRYLSTNKGEADVWLELATAERWRGNYSESHGALQAYRTLVGETPLYRMALASVFAEGGKPSKALELLEPLLAEAPDDYELNFVQTVAYTMKPRPSEARESLDTVRQLDAAEPRTDTAGRIVRRALGSSLGPSFSVYSDSDDLEIQRYGAETEIRFSTGTDLRAGFARHELQARLGSGLEQLSGASEASHEEGWIGVAQRLKSVVVEGRAGRSSTDSHDLDSYAIGAHARPADALTVSIERRLGFFVISPRTVGLGISRLTHQASVDWSPGLKTHVSIQASYHELSDTNELFEFSFAPRRSIARTEALNLDLGFFGYQYRARQDLNHGYYDPRKYEFYGAAAYPYWKANEDIGLSFLIMAGVQRDDDSPDFSAGGNAAVRATFGIYGPFVLNVSGAATFNRRLESGAFRGLRGEASLALRF
jgi:tetratricopeptide (TPR) repeat protein